MKMRVVGKFRHIFRYHHGPRISRILELQKLRPQPQSTYCFSSNPEEASSGTAASTSNKRYATGAFEEIKRHLQDIYSASDKQSHLMLRSIDANKLDEKNLIATLDILKEEEVPLDQLLRNPWILQFTKRKLVPRLSYLQSGNHMFTAASHCLPFCRHSMTHIKKYWAFLKHEKRQIPSQYPNKVYYVADRLQPLDIDQGPLLYVDEKEISRKFYSISIKVPLLTESMARSKHVLMAPFSRVKEIVDLYIHYGVPEKHILSDPYVFCYCVEMSKKRMDVMYGDYKAVDKRKLWITRCPEEQFAKSLRLYVEEREEEKLLLPYDGSLARYIAHQLDVSEDTVKHRMPTQFSYHPKPSKVRDVIDLLKAEGFTSQQILGTMSVLQYSLKRMRERVEVLRQLGVRCYSIRRLFCPQTQFELFCLTETCRKKNKPGSSAATEATAHRLKSLRPRLPEPGGGHSVSEGVGLLRNDVNSLNGDSCEPLNDDSVRPFSDDSDRPPSDDSDRPLSDDTDGPLRDNIQPKPLDNSGVRSLRDDIKPLNDESVILFNKDCVSSCNGR